jgi:hypothetical protein
MYNNIFEVLHHIEEVEKDSAEVEPSKIPTEPKDGIVASKAFGGTNEYCIKCHTRGSSPRNNLGT